MEIKENDKHSKEWLSIYLFGDLDFEKLLSNEIFDLVKTSKKNKLIDLFFFIRYFEGGRHLRLRFRLIDISRLKSISSFLISELRKIVVNLHPEGDIQGNVKWKIELVKYEPEFERYGGQEIIHLSEKQFDLSSYTIMNMFSYFSEWNQEIAINKAIILHMLFSYSVGMDLDLARRFYYRNYKIWLDHGIWMLKMQGKSGDDKELKRKFASFHEKSYSKNKKLLVNQLSKLFGPTRFDFMDQEYLGTWVHENRNIHQELLNFFTPERAYQPPFPHLKIYDSLVHMTNNRLGINNLDESLISYLIYKSIKDYKRENQT